MTFEMLTIIVGVTALVLLAMHLFVPHQSKPTH